jgi:hypothetical protein
LEKQLDQASGVHQDLFLGEFEYELEKPLEETNWLAVVKRYVSVPCDPLKLLMSSRES